MERTSRRRSRASYSSLVELCVAGLAVCGSVRSVEAAASDSTTRASTHSGSFPARRPATESASIHNGNQSIASNENKGLKDSTAASLSSSTNNHVDPSNGGGESDQEDDEADSSDDVEESSNVWMLLAKSPVDQTKNGSDPPSTADSSPRVDLQSAGGANLATVSPAQPPSHMQYKISPKTSKPNDEVLSNQRRSASGPTSSSSNQPKKPLVSQSLQTLEKLQQMLDETDYMTTSQRNQQSSIRRDSRASTEDPQGRSNVPEVLWTSKDRFKYKRQQQQRLLQQAKSPRNLDGKSTPTPVRPKFTVSPKTAVDMDDSDEHTDDGLGYVLPDLPVYHSDAEDEGGDAVEDGNGSVVSNRGSRPPPGTFVPRPPQNHPDSRYVLPSALDGQQSHQNGVSLPPGRTRNDETASSGLKPSVGPLGYTSQSMPTFHPYAPQFMSPEHQRYLMEQQILQQYYAQWASQQPFPLPPPPHHAHHPHAYTPFHPPYPMLPMTPNQSQNGFSVPFNVPPPQSHYSSVAAQPPYAGPHRDAGSMVTRSAPPTNHSPPQASFPARPGQPDTRIARTSTTPFLPRQSAAPPHDVSQTSDVKRPPFVPSLEQSHRSTITSKTLPVDVLKPAEDSTMQQPSMVIPLYPSDSVTNTFTHPYNYGHPNGWQLPMIPETLNQQVDLIPSQSLAEATSRLTFDSIQKISLLLMTSGLFAYSSVSPRTLPLTDYNLKFYENARVSCLAMIAPALYIFSVFDTRENDINSVVNSFFVSFTLGYLGTMTVEILVTTLLRLAAFCLFESDVFSLTPKVPIPILPWVLRENHYRPKRITLFAADFATSCVACPIIEECAKLLLLQWTARLPRNFHWVRKASAKRKKKRRVVEAIARRPDEPACLNANQYVTHMLAVSLGIKLSDVGRRILLYTKPHHANKSFFAICRGIFPIHELCGAMTAVALAKRDILGMDFPLWKLLGPSVVVHGMANFRGMKPLFKWNSATPWSEMQLYPINVPDASTFLDLLKTGYAKLMWAIVLGRVFGYCVKNYYMVNRQAVKRTTKYAGNHAAFSAELATTELLKKAKEKK